MKLLALAAVLAMTGTQARAAPRPRSERAVTIASSSDVSRAVLDPHTRSRHGAIVRRALLDVLERTGSNVRHPGIPLRQIDVSIVAWRIAPAGRGIDVSTELRVVICDDHGRMLSILVGRARISAPSDTRLAELREQALTEAVGGMSSSLQSQLARETS
jgi:hypothetical protein